MSAVADDCGGPARQVADADGGPAFPAVPATLDGKRWSSGMSLRDHFAVHAPAAPDWYLLPLLALVVEDSFARRQRIELAWPYVWADAQIAERNKTTDAPAARCSVCGRIEYDTSRIGGICAMPQPGDTSIICGGTLL